MKKLVLTSLNRPEGFSFAEVMITLSLFIILAGIGVGAYFRYYNFALINQDVNHISTILQQTRFKALKNPASDNYGVHIDPADRTVTSFRDTYTEGNNENIVVVLEQVDITNLNLQPAPGLTDEILFDGLTGKTQNHGAFTISGTDFNQVFTINLQGGFE